MINAHPTIEELSRAFYEADPLNLCCVPNGNTDEYDMEAAATIDDMITGMGLHDAVTASLVQFFEIDEDRAYRLAVEVAEQLYRTRMQGP